MVSHGKEESTNPSEMSFSRRAAPSKAFEARPRNTEEGKNSPREGDEEQKNLEFEDPFEDEFIEEEVVDRGKEWEDQEMEDTNDDREMMKIEDD
jgi:hypothetical protein